MEAKVSRDSVAAGDDVESHDASLEIDGRRKLVDFLAEIARRSYLPVIQGGRATWIVRTGRRGRPIAVVAQQWQQPQLLVGASVEIADLGERFHFEYLAQEDPHAVVDRLRALFECPVCGSRQLTTAPYERWPPPPDVLLAPPYEHQLGRPSYEVCPNCGFEFGNDDHPGTTQPQSFEEYRAAWQARGTPRFSGR